MNKQAVTILIFSSSILIAMIMMTLSVDCDLFKTKMVSDKCHGDMTFNLIFVSVIMTPFIFGSAYYIFPMKASQKTRSNAE